MSENKTITKKFQEELKDFKGASWYIKMLVAVYFLIAV